MGPQNDDFSKQKHTLYPASTACIPRPNHNKFVQYNTGAAALFPAFHSTNNNYY